jgi:hypothetical protein
MLRSEGIGFQDVMAFSLLRCRPASSAMRMGSSTLGAARESVISNLVVKRATSPVA